MSDNSYLFHRHEFVSLIFVSSDQVVRCDHRLCAVRSHRSMSAIVEKDHIAAANLPDDFLFDYCGGRRVPVVASHVPHDGFEAEFAGNS